MTDLTKGQQAETETPEPIATPEGKPVAQVSIDDFNSLKKAFDDIKAAQSGSDRRVSELTKENEELKKSSMSDKERLAYEQQIAEQEKQSFERAKKELEIERLKYKFIADNKLDSKFSDFLTADSEEGMSVQLGSLQAIIADHIKPIQEELNSLKAGMGRPGGGNGTGHTNLKEASLAEQTAWINSRTAEVGREKAIAEYNNLMK